MNKRTIDPERLAAFLDGRLDAAARVAVVEELSHADSETLIAFGDAASIVRESAQPTLSARPWSRRTVLAGTTVLAAAAVFAAVMLPRYLGRNDVDGQTSAHYATLLDSVAVRAQPARALVFRGAVGLSTPTGLAVRVGAHITDLAVAIERGQSTASTLAATLAFECEAIPGGGAAGATYRRLAEALDAGRRPDAKEFRRAAVTAEASAGESSTRLGAWIEAARYAATNRDASFFARPESRVMLGRSTATRGGADEQSGMSDVRREAARPNIDWRTLADALDRALTQLAG
jgi:hypothetical protein